MNQMAAFCGSIHEVGSNDFLGCLFIFFLFFSQKDPPRSFLQKSCHKMGGAVVTCTAAGNMGGRGGECRPFEGGGLAGGDF